jgi:hypothetical protein
MRVIAALIGALTLGGCAGSPVGDAIAGPAKLAQVDDAYCRSIGVEADTPGYANCRQTLTQNRDEYHVMEVARAKAAVAAAASRLRE